MRDGLGEQLVDAIRRTLGNKWDVATRDGRLTALHRDHSSCFVPTRRSRSLVEILDLLEAGFADRGVVRARCLPLRWGRETDLTVSAVQALDPLLKDARDWTYRTGFLPQPVVRLTGKRDLAGEFRDGYLSSFVNVSHIQPIEEPKHFAAVIDVWFAVLSRLGLHARNIAIYGPLTVWQRRQVQGITLRFQHAGVTFGDVNMLWNRDRPDLMASDLGSGLERIGWLLSGRAWGEVVHGRFAAVAASRTLDAIRTATLLLGYGIRPGPRGAGATTRKILNSIGADCGPLGVDAYVRFCHRYWTAVHPLRADWPAIASAIDVGRERHDAS